MAGEGSAGSCFGSSATYHTPRRQGIASGLQYPLALTLTLRAFSARTERKVLASRSRKWLAKTRLFWYRMTMSKVLEIESALRQLPVQDQWEVARWLLAACRT